MRGRQGERERGKRREREGRRRGIDVVCVLKRNQYFPLLPSCPSFLFSPGTRQIYIGDYILLGGGEVQAAGDQRFDKASFCSM